MLRLNRILAFVWGWLLIIVCVVGSVNTMALNEDFYIQRYEKMNLAKSLHVSQDDLNKSIELLLDYIRDDTDSLEDTITINGYTQNTFNEREKSHMVDVKALYQNAIGVGKASFVCLLVILFYLAITQKKKTVAYLTKGILQASVCLILVFVFFGIWIGIDFTGFWTWFHTIFFSNNLWLLNPVTDFMINMLPETIFYQLVLSCVLMVCVLIIPCIVFSIYYQRKRAPIGFEYEDHIS